MLTVKCMIKVEENRGNKIEVEALNDRHLAPLETRKQALL